MSTWGAAKARRVFAALLRLGWSIKRESGSHQTLARPGWPIFVFAFHDSSEIGPRVHRTRRAGRRARRNFLVIMKNGTIYKNIVR